MTLGKGVRKGWRTKSCFQLLQLSRGLIKHLLNLSTTNYKNTHFIVA